MKVYYAAPSTFSLRSKRMFHAKFSQPAAAGDNGSRVRILQQSRLQAPETFVADKFLGVRDE